MFLQASPPHRPFASTSALTTIMNRYRKLAGLSVEEFGSGAMHSLRHTLATRMMEHNVPLETISSILGHRSLGATTIYTKASLPVLRTACLDPDAVVAKEDGQ